MRVYIETGRTAVDDHGRDDAAAFCTSQFPRLVGGLGLYLSDRAVAEELAQEALLRAFTRWGRVSRLESPEAWVWRVALNLANSTFRRRAAERRARARLSGGHVGVVDDDPVARLAVRSVVADLPDRQRAALVLRYYLDLDVGETAARMGVSENAVRSLTKRAVAQLRRVLVTDEVAERLEEGCT